MSVRKFAMILCILSSACSSQQSGQQEALMVDQVRMSPDRSTAEIRDKNDPFNPANSDITQIMTEARVTNIAQSVRKYLLDNKTPPLSLHDLWSCSPQSRGKCTPYLDRKLSLEPWGNGYFYHVDSAAGVIVLGSFGRDGVAGGEGLDRDTVVLLSTKEP